MVSLLTNICITRYQWFKQIRIFLKNLFANISPYNCNISVWNWSFSMTVYSALWILMARCFRTKTSVAMVLTTYPCVSNCLGVKPCCRHSGDYQWQIISRHNIDLLINNVLHVLCADILPFVFYLKCFPNYHMISLDKGIKISKKNSHI